MKIHESGLDNKAAGYWDIGTTRYVPMNGGSRSRLPIAYDDIRRYYGFVGMDERLTETISTMGALYKHIGGGIVAAPGTESYINRLLEQSKKWIKPVAEEGS